MRRLWVIVCWVSVSVLAFDESISITSPRPLNDASVRLERVFGKPVTYEESLRVWPGELAGHDGSPPKKWGGLVPLKWDLYPKMETFRMPLPSSDMEDSAQRTVAAFNQSSEGTRFDVLPSKYGVHIVQRRGHDEHGRLVDVRSALDARITIPTAARTPREHLSAFTAAVTAVTGIKFEADAFPFNADGFNRAYKTPLPPMTWGTKSTVARDALIDFLRRSPNTFSWRLNCQSSAQPLDRGCLLNLGFVAGTIVNAGPR